jgi:Holliday junction DNA helicase RuvB
MAQDKDTRMVSGQNQPEDDGALDRALRPQTLDALIGQDKIRDNLRILIQASRARGEALDHILIYGPPGLGKCIVGESLVLTGGGLVELQRFVPRELPSGSYAPCEARVCGLNGMESTSHIYVGGHVPTIRMKTRSGFELEGTPNHPVLVATPEGPQWRKLSDLTEADYVAIARDTQVWGSDKPIAFVPQYFSPSIRKERVNQWMLAAHTELSKLLHRPPSATELELAYTGDIRHNVTIPVSAHRLGLKLADGRHIKSERNIPLIQVEHDVQPYVTSLDPDVAYLMGLVVGDGHFEQGKGQPAFSITSSESFIHIEVERICREKLHCPFLLSHYRDRSSRISFSQNIGHLMIHLGVKPVLAAEKAIPDSVLTGSVEVARGFLQGLFDADGNAWRDFGYVEYTSKSERLVRQVQILLANFGVIAHRRPKSVDNTVYWQLFIGGRNAVLFQERVGFRLPRKQANAEQAGTITRGVSRSDMVPFAHRFLSELFNASRPHTHSMHKRFYHVLKGDRLLSRQQIAKYLELLPEEIRAHPAAQKLAVVSNPNFYWDKVVSLEARSAEVYDFCVPGTHSFVANGFFNHNTTLSHVIGHEMGTAVRVTSGPAIERAGDLAAILTNLRKGDILFIDEIHRLNRAVEEVLYPAMEDYALDIVIGKGPSARSVRLKLPPITIIGATTRLALITAPLRARFGAQYRVDFYPLDAMEQIIARAASLLNTPIDPQALTDVARRARGTPRVALRLLKRVRDYAQVKGDGHITPELAREALMLMDVDPLGLDDLDRRVLSTIIEKFGGGPVGLETIAASISEESDTIMDVVEPYLLQLGFLDRTPRGRIATQHAYDHLNIPYTPPLQPGLI